MSSLYITLREIIEFSVIVLLLFGIYKESRKMLITSAVLAIAAGTLITLFLYPLSGFHEKAYTDFMFYSFIMILLLSFVSGKEMIYPLICIVLALLLPSAQLASVIISETVLKGWPVLIYSLVGFLAGALVFTLGLRFLSKLDLKRFLGTDGIMVVLASFCFLFGGLNEFDNSSFVTTLQNGLHKLLSSLFIFLKENLFNLQADTSVNTFNYLSSQRIAMALTALILFIPPLYVFIRLLLTPEPVTGGIGIKAEKRKLIAIHRDVLMRKGTPLIVAMFVNIILLHSANLAMNPIFDPEPIPLVVEGETLTIPLTEQYGDITDGRLRKFSFRSKGEAYRFMVIMRPDGDVVAALDACEICPSGGYVQRGEHVICKYCSTPIPLQSLGHPGGCNPIPVPFEIEGETLIVEKDNIVSLYDKWIDTD
jgi:hypothetical protein